MPSFVGRPADLAISGALVALKLWVPESVTAERTRQAKPVVPPIDTLAEVDTGAMHTIIQEGVATSLGLDPVGTTKITTVTTPVYECYLYRIQLLFPQGCTAEILAIEAPYIIRPNARTKCLIGRDILKHSLLIYNGLTNMFSLIF